jgi:phosphatidylglycerol---prolipoprotein diacylglyceryl transferase
MVGSFFWNPSREIIFLPFINIPLLWYGVLFASGFAVGYLIFISILKRYFVFYPEYYLGDIISSNAISDKIERANSFFSIKSETQKLSKKEVIGLLNTSVNEDVQNVNSTARFENRLILDEKFDPYVVPIAKKPQIIADKILLYVVIATIIGSRLGHFLFYENPADYLNNLTQILRIRDGGHASHGAAFGIFLSVAFFSRWVKKYSPNLNWLKTLDLICIPTALAGAFIRVGNFINQEILGKASNLPWSVIFGSPADLSAPIARHPVQLYEAGFYLLTFIILFFLSYKKSFLQAKGKLIGIFLTFVFSFRFFIEYLKEGQSYFTLFDGLNMGQLLSIPLVLLGIIFISLKKQKYSF